MKRRFVIYGLLGWVIEVVWTGLGSFINGDIEMQGQTYIWMFPIYGLAVFLEPVHDKIRDWPVFIRGGVYTIFIFMIEYTTGWLLQILIGVCPWDYSSYSPFAIDGFIRLDYAPAWFLAGLLFEKIHDMLKREKWINI